MSTHAIEHVIEPPASGEFAPYFQRYIGLVGTGEIIHLLDSQIHETLTLFRNAGEENAEYRYAEGKWSIKETLGHLVDTERVLAFRAHHFSRNDSVPLPSFEQDDYVREGPYEGQSIERISQEWDAVRRSTLYLLQSLRPDDWLRSGIANNSTVSVRALAYIIAGHELHHRKIMIERYLPGIQLAV